MRASDFENELSTEQIRNRMIKNASRIWGVEIEDIESTFDPLVTMLIEACSYELNKINREMMSSRTRIMNRLAQTLTPETLIGAQPAHTIIQARSIEVESFIDKEAQFSTVVKQHAADVDKKEITKEIYFSPLTNFKLFDAQIKYSIASNKIVEYKNAVSRQVIAEEPRTSLIAHTLWLGLEVNPKIQQLDDFVFFMDWKNDPDKEKYLKILPLTKWSIGPYKLEILQGIDQSLNMEAVSGNIDDEYNITLRTERLVQHFYNDSFYTLKSGDSAKIKLQDFLTTYPSEVSDIFSSQTLSKIQGKFLWIKLQFNSSMPVNAVHDVFVSMNSFPAINRKVNRISYQLKNNLNIVPLVTESFFHDMINVTSSDGPRYRSNPLDSGFNNAEGFFTLRQSGVERFDQRHSMELLNNLIDRLRDESAAFSSLGNDFINVQINQINQALAMIENRIDLKGTKESPTQFLVVKPLRKNDTIFAKFWTTNGTDANIVKPGTKLTLQSGADVKSDSLVTIVSTSSGKMPLSENEKVIAYKKALLTHNRLLTEQDIHTFCTFELGSLVQNVEIRKSWEVTPDRKSGITRVIEVRLFPMHKDNFIENEWNDLSKSLQTKIKLQSNDLLPLKVIVVSPNVVENN